MTARIPVAALLLASATVAGGAPPVGAVDDSKPAVSCYGLAFTDRKGDAISTAPAASVAQPGNRDNLDLIGGFYKFDQAKGDQAATFNIQLANLSTSIPTGDTALSWYVSYGAGGDGDPWVRALTDFTGTVSYEYGHYMLIGPQTQSVRDGSTQGAFFTGENGVIQIVYPATGAGKPGTVLKQATITSNEAIQVLPGAAPTPVKGGLLYASDTAKTDGDFTVGSPCPAATPPAPAAGEGAAPASPVNAGSAPLPVKVLTTRFKLKHVKRSIALGLKSSETVTQLGAQLKGLGKAARTVYGKGALAKLSGKGKLKLRLSRKLKKGGYELDLVGTDSQGARRFTAAKLTIR